MTNQQPTNILLIRHGLTDWNVAKRWQGHADIPLNETGQKQADALAKRLADWPIDAIISSDLQRCAQTAVALAAQQEVDPVFDPIWRERDVGDFSGLTSEQAQAQFPHIWANGKRGMIDPPNGEPFREVRRRAMAAFEKTANAFSGQTVAVISHGGLLHALIAQLIGVDEAVYGRFSMRGNTGLSIVEVTDNGPYLTLLNDTSHLKNGLFS